jgi:hypothetical protein
MLSVLVENCNLADMIRYNVEKVKAGKAMELTAKFWPLMIRDHKDSPIVHHILSFPPGEKVDNELLVLILENSMERCGLREHPYVAYLHLDTATPHVHQLICLYDVEGNRLDFQKLKKGIRKINRILEQRFDLTRMQPNRGPQVYERPDLRTRPAHMGEIRPVLKVNWELESKKSIIDAATKRVIEHYRFGSIDEFNALLHPYRVKGIISQNGEIYYVVLNEKDKPAGMYISASQLKGRPNMRLLNWRMDRFNEDAHKPEAAHHIRVQVNFAMIHNVGKGVEAFLNNLKAKGLFVSLSTPKYQDFPEIIYIDQEKRVAMHQDTVGQDYVTKVILKACHCTLPELIHVLDKLKDNQRIQGPTLDPGQWRKGLSMY